MTKTKRLGKILTELRLITYEQLDAALLCQQKTPQKDLGELLVELGMLEETDLLKCLSGLFRVRYISSDKLAGMNIPRWVISLIPPDFAERHTVLPFFCYDKTRILSMLSAKPDNRDLLREIRKVSGYDAEMYLALESTIKAGISRFFHSDLSAFQRLKERSQVRIAAATAGLTAGDQEEIGCGETSTDSAVAHDLSECHEPCVLETLPEKREKQQKNEAGKDAGGSFLNDDTLLKLLSIIITLLEFYKGDRYRGHSTQVASMVTAISRAYGLQGQELFGTMLAAYLHDCCLNASEHLTLLYFCDEKSEKLLEKYTRANERLLENINLPTCVTSILSHTFERFDGRGLPDQLAGEQIPLGSRIIAAVDSFLACRDMTRQHDAVQASRSALELIASHASTLFDPQVVAFLETTATARLKNENACQVLFAVCKAEEFGDAITRLESNGISARCLGTIEEACGLLAEAAAKVIVCEITTDTRDALSFCSAIKIMYPDVHFLFLSRQHDPVLRDKALAAGAYDVITAPCTSDILFTKIMSCILNCRKADDEEPLADSAPVLPSQAGVSGNLAEIRATDLIQMLFSVRKTGRLKLFKGDEEGEISFDHGEIVEASCRDLDAVTAFNYLVRWDHGLFTLDTNDELPQRRIFDSTERLLLEAYQLWDEEDVQPY
ncbi:MAG TPA: DUF4388 domain-containing protein [Thermodesulfobacteriota bacterium]|nr:DUF4388 domain-containing protein [Thermodesulfobacteriota bacterium]